MRSDSIIEAVTNAFVVVVRMKAETLRKLLLGYVTSLLVLFVFGAAFDHGRAKAASAVGALLLLAMFAVIDYCGIGEEAEEEEVVVGRRAKGKKARRKYTRVSGKARQA
jgi:hypothetical protein